MLFGYVTWLLITNWQNKNSNIFILKDDITYYLILLPVGGYTQLTKTGKITIIHFYPIFYKTSNYYFYLAIELVIMLLYSDIFIMIVKSIIFLTNSNSWVDSMFWRVGRIQDGNDPYWWLVARRCKKPFLFFSYLG